MATPTFEIVHKGERLALVFNAMATMTGNAGRAYWGFWQDSLGFITATRNDARGLTGSFLHQEVSDTPGSYWEGVALALKNKGFTCYGSAVMNYCGPAGFASLNALGWAAGAEADVAINTFVGAITGITASATPVVTFSTTHPFAVGDKLNFTLTNSTPPLAGDYTVGAIGASTVTLAAGQITTSGTGNIGYSVVSGTPSAAANADAFPYTNVGMIGPPLYVPAGTTAPASASFANAGSLFGNTDQSGATGSVPSSWVCPFLLANPNLADVRCNFSYRALAACTINTCLKSALGGASTKLTITPTGATEWTNASILRTAATTTYYLMFQLYDYDTVGTTGKSTGPFLIDGIQFCLGSIDPETPTAGPGGFAVGPVFCKGGYSLTKTNAEMAYAGVPAMARFMRACRRSSEYFVACVCYAGNDSGHAINSFVTGDPPALDASTYTSGSGPLTNTAAGMVQNWKSMTAFLKAAWALAGGDPSKLIALHMYHTQPTAPYNTYIPAAEQALCDWVDSGAPGSEIVVVCRGTRALPASEIAAIRGYNALAFTVTGISAANPGVVTTNANHNLASGDKVAFRSTNSTPVLTEEYWITVLSATTFSLYSDQARATGVNVTGAGSAGTGVAINKDTPHLQVCGFLAFTECCINAVMAAVAQTLAAGRRFLPFPLFR